MMPFRIIKNKSIKTTWIATYLTLFLLPVFIYIVTFIILDGKIKDDVNKSNSILLKQVQQYMDTLVNDTENMAIDLAFNYRVEKILTLEGNLNDEDRYRLLELYRDIRSKLHNHSIEEVYIFFNKIGMVVSSKYMMPSDTYFKVFCDNNDIDLQDWININHSIYRGDFIHVPAKNKGTKNKGQKLAYVLSLMNNRNIDGNANIVVVLDKSKFLGMVEDIEALRKGNVAILNTKNEIVLSSDGFTGLDQIAYANLAKESGVEYTYSGSSKFATSYINSKIKKWKYIYSMPTTEYWDSLERFRKIINIGIVVSMIIGCAAVNVFFRKNYKPVKQLLSTIYGMNHKTLDGGKNEFNVIKDVLTRTVSEKEAVEKWFSSQKEVLRCRYIERLLKHTLEEDELNKRDMLDIALPWNNFSVMVFYIENLECFSEGDSSKTLESFKLIQFMIHNMLDELIRGKGIVYTIDTDNHILSLLNIEGSNLEMQQYLRCIGDKIRTVLRDHFKLEITIVMSKIYGEMTMLNRAYRDTVELLEFKEVVGGEGVLFYNDINNDTTSKYYYPLEQEQALINAVKAGDYQRTHKLIREIFDKNMDNKKISSNLARCLKFNFVGTMTNIVNELVDIYGDYYFRYFVLIEDFVQQKNIIKLEESLLTVLKEICEKIEYDKKAGSQIGNKVMAYINENFKQENLNLTLIAELFDMHPAYISRQFKLQTGHGILDYINIVRVEQAKNVIKSGNGNLDTIARNVGYSNVRTFTRAFVKIVGITPGKYKS